MEENKTTAVKTPDALLENIGKSIMFKAMMISIIGHIVFTGATSISLWKDWASDWERFGLKAPGTINAIKGADKKAADEAKRKADAAAKAEAEAKAAAEKKEAEAKERDKQAKAALGTKAAGATGTNGTVNAKGEKVPPEVQPLPPKKDFELGDDLSLD